jgi:hypothetical protein
MDEWRSKWRRIGGGLAAAAATLGVSFYVGSRPSALVVEGKIREIGPGHGWVVIVFVVLVLAGLYLVAAAEVSWVPWFGKAAAGLPGCDIKIRPEFDPDAMEVRGNGEYRGCAHVFLVIENTEDTSTYSGYFSGISGLKRDGDGVSLDDYFGKIAWEDTIEDRQIIGAGGRAKMIAMCLFMTPHVSGWFQIPYSAKWASVTNTQTKKQLAGWPFIPVRPGGDIMFDVRIVNESKRVSGKRQVTIRWKTDGTVADQSISDWL